MFSFLVFHKLEKLWLVCVCVCSQKSVGVGIVKALKKKKKESTQIGQLTLQRIIYKADFTGRSTHLFGLSVLIVNNPSFSFSWWMIAYQLAVSNPETLAFKSFSFEFFRTLLLVLLQKCIWLFTLIFFHFFSFLHILDTFLDLCLNPSLHRDLIHKRFCLCLKKEVLMYNVAQMWEK